MSITITAAESYRRDGFLLSPPILPADLVERAVKRMDAVIAGEYETGREPFRDNDNASDPNKLCKIDQGHIADSTLLEVVSHPEIGRWAAAITGAKMIQVWAVQLLHKPPSGSAKGNVGWHQDYQYWKQWWTPDSEVFTCWVALSDVKEDSGPMYFVKGSHLWGFFDEGDFFDLDIEKQKAQIKNERNLPWEEVPAVLPAGAVSFHHKLTYHGSGPNVSDGPRRSFAVHLRTEKSTPLWEGNTYYVSKLEDPSESPIIFDER